MGNGRWWTWKCPNCERHTAVEKKTDSPPEDARCPSCNEYHLLDEHPLE